MTVLSSSLSTTSKSHRILQHPTAELRGSRPRMLPLPPLSPRSPRRAVIAGTSVYKAAYSGLLKTFLDLLSQDGLAILPLATGGGLAHTLAPGYAGGFRLQQTLSVSERAASPRVLKHVPAGDREHPAVRYTV